MKKTKVLNEEKSITISLSQCFTSYSVNERTCIRRAGNEILKNFRKITRLTPVMYVPKFDLNYCLEVLPILDEANEFCLFFRKVGEANNKLPEFERKLLYKKYFSHDNKGNISIYMSLNLSESTFYRLLSDSIVHFMEGYNGGKILHEILLKV